MATELDREAQRSTIRLHAKQVERLRLLATREGGRGVANILPAVLEKVLAWEAYLREEFESFDCPRCKAQAEWQPGRVASRHLSAELSTAVKFVYPPDLRAHVEAYAESEGASPTQALWQLVTTGEAYWSWPGPVSEAEPEYDFG